MHLSHQTWLHSHHSCLTPGNLGNQGNALGNCFWESEQKFRYSGKGENEWQCQKGYNWPNSLLVVWNLPKIHCHNIWSEDFWWVPPWYCEVPGDICIRSFHKLLALITRWNLALVWWHTKKSRKNRLWNLFWLGVLLGPVFPCTLRRLVSSASLNHNFLLSFLCYTVDAPPTSLPLIHYYPFTGSTIIPSPTKLSQTPIIGVPPVVARCQSGIMGGK